MTSQMIGKYRVIRELGRGGMGVVYLAVDDDVKREVALKVIAPRFADHRDSVERFHREIRAAATLDHKNIVTVFDIAFDAHPPHYTMRYVDGFPLSRLIGSGLVGTTEGENHAPANASTFEFRMSDGGPITEAAPTAVGRPVEVSTAKRAHGSQIRRIVMMLAKVARALEYAHHNGVVHRDVKPSNILVDRDLEPYVVDFGLARVATEDSLTETGALLGTPEYLAPERLGSGAVTSDHRVDIYSLGVTLFELLAGRKPFSAETRENLYREVLFSSAPRLRTFNPEISQDLETIVAKCLEKSPDDRFQSMADLADDLEAVLELRPIRARPVAWPTRFCRLVARKKAVAAAALLVIVAIVGLLFVVVRTALELRRVETEKIDIFAAQGMIESIGRPYSLSPASRNRLAHWSAAAEDLLRKYPASERTDAGRSAARAVEDEVLSDALDRLQKKLDLVRGDLERIEKIERISLVDGAAAWTDAIEKIADAPIYAGLTLRPIAGLLPLGENPKTKLQEFWVVATGNRPPAFDARSTTLPFEAGMILCLLPGGDFRMGAPASDRATRERTASIEAPRDLTMRPFFMSRYEATTSQFHAVMGYDPSIVVPRNVASIAYPAQNISWDEAFEFAVRLDLWLPDEAEWEYACRAGSTTDFFFGDSPEDMEDYGNICDQTTGLHSAESWSDRYGGLAPVGSYRGNPFGLFDLHGNVAEWCFDAWRADYERPAKTLEGSVVNRRTPRAFRGGNCVTLTAMSRSGWRSYQGAGSASPYLGVRLCRPAESPGMVR